MSILLSPVSFTVHNKFNPLANTSATSLVDHLPIGSEANCLLLNGCDPRKIMYTLYAEENKGKSLNSHQLTWSIPSELRPDLLRGGTRSPW